MKTNSHRFRWLRCLLAISLITVQSVAQSEENTPAPFNEGWHHIDPNAVGIADWISAEKKRRAVKKARNQLNNQAKDKGSGSREDSLLAQLARGLEHDPVQLYRFVVNRIHFSPSYGFQKGPGRTYLDEAGNSLDQAVLLALLLEISSAENPALDSDVSVIIGKMTYPMADLAKLFGCDPEESLVIDFLSDGFIPFEQSADEFEIQQTWVEFSFNGTLYKVLPSHKQYKAARKVDWPSATGFSPADILEEAEGEETANWVKDVNETKVEDYLKARAMDLHQFFEGDHLYTHIEDLLGRLSIERQEIEELPLALPYPSSEVRRFTANEIPDEYRYRVSLTYGSLSYETFLDCLGTSDLSLTFADGNLPELKPFTLWSFNGIPSVSAYQISPRTIKIVFANVGTNRRVSYRGISISDGVSNLIDWSALQGQSFSLGLGETKEFTLAYEEGIRPGDTFKFFVQTSNLPGVTGDVGLGTNAEFTAYEVATLALNGQTVAVDNDEAEPTDSIKLTMSVAPPAATARGSSFTYNIVRGGVYALVCGFGDSQNGGRLRVAQDRLFEAKQDEDDTSTFFAANLEMIGQAWLNETSLIEKLIAELQGYRVTYSHRLGMVAQDNGYYIDFKNQISSSSVLSSDSAARALSSGSIIQSAFEHATLEHLQNGLPAVSTAKILSLANQEGQRIYTVDADNFSAVSEDLGGYNGLEPLVEGGNLIILPQLGAIRAGDWQGFGYFAEIPNIQFGAIIGGGHFGGFSFFNQDLQPAYVLGSSQFSTVNNTANDLVANTGGDPVILQEGSFLFEQSLLRIGNKPEPLGLEFAIDYGSSRQSSDNTIAPNWRHSYEYSAKPGTLPGVSLGDRRASDAVAALVVAQTITELEDDRSAKSWLVRAIAANWLGKQYVNGAILLDRSGSSHSFSRLPDGRFQSPPGHTGKLVEIENGFELQGRYGLVEKFLKVDEGYPLASMTDIFGNTLECAYDEGKLQTVTDASGRSLTFSYTEDTLTSVADSTGRDISFDRGDSGDLDSFTDTLNYVYSFTYSNPGKIQDVINPDGETVTENYYGPLGKVARQLSQGANKWLYKYTPYSAIVVDPLGGTEKSFFNDDKLLTSFINQEGSTTGRQFNAQDLLIETTGARGQKVSHVYDDRFNRVGQKLHLTDDDFLESTALFDDANNRVQTTDPRGNVTNFTYDEFHQVLSRQDPEGHTQESVWNANGTPAKVIDEEGRETVFESYDAFQNAERIVSPDGNVSQYGYSTLGDQLTYTDPRGNTWQSAWDAGRNQISITDPDSGVNSWTYHFSGVIASHLDQLGNTTTYDFNSLNKLVKFTDPEGNETTFEHDIRDEVVAAISPLGNETRFEADRAKRPSATIDSLGNATEFNLDEDGNVLATINALAEEEVNVFDIQGRLISTTNPRGEQTQFTFDKNGNQTALTNAAGAVFSSEFDARNLETSSTTPEGKVTSRSYTNRGNLKAVIEPSGDQADYEYDQNGRLVQSADSVATRSIIYDANGNVISIAEGDETLSYEYDALNRLVSFTDKDNSTTRYEYDANSNITAIIYPGDLRVAYTYTARSQLATVTDWLGNVTSFIYDADGRNTRILLPNGTTRNFTHDAASQLIKIVDLDINGFIIYEQSTTHDAAGKVEDEFTLPLAPHDWQPTPQANSYNLDNELISFNGQPVTSDLDGNLLRAPLSGADGLQDFAFDARNRLLSIADHSYTYGVSGERNSIEADGNVTKLIVDPNHDLSRVLITENAEEKKTFYIYGLGLLYQLGAAGELHCYHYDSRGSTTAISAADGQTVAARYDYSPYGTVITSSGDFETLFKYNGRFGVQDDGSGLNYMRARCYSPYLRRFINPDPIGFAGGLNWYAYANGNPVSLIDPFGLGPIGSSVFSSDQASYGWSGFSDFVSGVMGEQSTTFFVGGGFTIPTVDADINFALSYGPSLSDFDFGVITNGSAGISNALSVNISGGFLDGSLLDQEGYFIQAAFSAGPVAAGGFVDPVSRRPKGVFIGASSPNFLGPVGLGTFGGETKVLSFRRGILDRFFR